MSRIYWDFTKKTKGYIIHGVALCSLGSTVGGNLRRNGVIGRYAGFCCRFKSRARFLIYTQSRSRSSPDVRFHQKRSFNRTETSKIDRQLAARTRSSPNSTIRNSAIFLSVGNRLEADAHRTQLLPLNVGIEAARCINWMPQTLDTMRVV